MGDRDLCIASEMDDYLSKPFKSENLLAMLTKWRTAPEAAANADSGPDLLPGDSAEAGSPDACDLQTTRGSPEHEQAADAA
jgi:DNA-binding response OmpR family regulator